MSSRLFPLVFASSLLAATVSFAQAPAPGAPSAEPTAAEIEAAEKEFYEYIESFGWQREGVGALGNKATIAIPEGYRFSGADGCRQLMEVYGNPATDTEEGVIAPENLDWCVVFEFEDVGYVSDEDKDELNAAKILKDLQEGQERSNEYRKEHGMGSLFITGWSMEPRYNVQTNNLEWGILLEDDEGGQAVNHLTRVLGRAGVMSVTLVADPGNIEAVMPVYQRLMTGFQYIPGQTYAEYKEGDPIAKYTLAGLITAGAGFAAMKTGLFGKLGLFFAKLGKAAILLVIGAALAVKKFFGRLFGGGRQQIQTSDTAE